MIIICVDVSWDQHWINNCWSILSNFPLGLTNSLHSEHITNGSQLHIHTYKKETFISDNILFDECTFELDNFHQIAFYVSFRFIQNGNTYDK